MSRIAKIEAYNTGQYYVRAALKAPQTAEFPYIDEVRIWADESCSFRIMGFVDTQNSFGALLSTKYDLKLTRGLQD